MSEKEGWGVGRGGGVKEKDGEALSWHVKHSNTNSGLNPRLIYIPTPLKTRRQTRAKYAEFNTRRHSNILVLLLLFYSIGKAKSTAFEIISASDPICQCSC